MNEEIKKDIKESNIVSVIKNSALRGDDVFKDNLDCLNFFEIYNKPEKGLEVIEDMLIDINKWIASINNIKHSINTLLKVNLEEIIKPQPMEITAALHPNYLNLGINNDIKFIALQYYKIKRNILKMSTIDEIDHHKEFLDMYHSCHNSQKNLFGMKKKLLVYKHSVQNYLKGKK